MVYSSLMLSFKFAVITSIILFLIGVPIAYWCAYTRSRWRYIVDTIVTLPLVLPPTVMGFYLLIALSPQNGFGKWLSHSLELDLLFSFHGMVLASVIYSRPFMVNPIKNGLKSIPQGIIDTLNLTDKSWYSRLWRVYIPYAKPSVITGLVMTFAHTLGEFGIVLMIGGSIPGVTKVASIAIYEEVETLNYSEAHTLSAILLIVSFLVILVTTLVNRPRPEKSLI